MGETRGELLVPLGGALSVGPHVSLLSGAVLGTLALGYQHLQAPRLVPTETFERTRLTRAQQALDCQVSLSTPVTVSVTPGSRTRICGADLTHVSAAPIRPS
jgi:hypothetical protein